MTPVEPLPLANLECFYRTLCRAAGLEFRDSGPVRWYDWLSADQIVRIFFADWQDQAAVQEELYPWLLRFPLAVSVLCWEPQAPGIANLLQAAGMEISLNAWGMELQASAQPPKHDQIATFRIAELVSASALTDYARLVGTHLTGHHNADSFAAFARVLTGGLSCGIQYLAAYADGGQMVATTTLFCNADSGHAGIYHVVTLPEYRGRGLALALVSQAVKLAQRAGMKRIILQTARPNARRIYEQIGFRRTIDYRRWTRKEALP